MEDPLPRPDAVAAATLGSVPSGHDRIHTSRSLRFDEVRAVGFDMDYTLAVYIQSEMDALSIDLTVRRLIERGYPERLTEIDYPTDFAIRGLLVDTRHGNVLKMDRYRYVKRAYHGLTELSRDERRGLYESRRLRPGSDRYHWIDTLYGVSEVAVFSAVVAELELEDDHVDHAQVFTDIRECIDGAHRTGEVFEHLRADPARYIRRDDRLGPTLHRLRSAGKKVFLITNSPPESTDVIMSFLLDETDGPYPAWKQYFDVVTCSARKPGFFTGADPFEDAEAPGEPVTCFSRNRMYTGGNRVDFERMFGISGPDVLYVGDHIYGDVVRAHVESNWRTMMVIQELPAEMAVLEAKRDRLRRIDELDDLLAAAHDELRFEKAVRSGELDLADGVRPPSLPGLEDSTALLNRVSAIERERDGLADEVEDAFHPYWGSLLKAGGELSMFGAQVEQYAWLYTERVTNLLGYSPFHYFRSPHTRMPHEL